MTYLQYEIIDFDDGHRPGNTTVVTKLAINEKPGLVNTNDIFDDLLPAQWLQRAYDYAKDHAKPWGVYIENRDMITDELNAESVWSNDPQRAIAMMATKSLLERKLCNSDIFENELSYIHGVAVWCLCSGVTDVVEYHIDYAELYRYETNVIHPPVLGAVVHVSPFYGEEDMIGGDFWLNTRGLEHYKEFGYKGKLRSPNDLIDDLQSKDWQKIPYLHNRGILFDGNFPHLVTQVAKIRNSEKRVILGLNFFSSAVGECCIRAPEHSDAFNRTIKIYQLMASTGLPLSKLNSNSTESVENESVNNELMTKLPNDENAPEQSHSSCTIMHSKTKAITIDEVKKNPLMRKFIVAAAKSLKNKEIN